MSLRLIGYSHDFRDDQESALVEDLAGALAVVISAAGTLFVVSSDLTRREFGQVKARRLLCGQRRLSMVQIDATEPVTLFVGGEALAYSERGFNYDIYDGSNSFGVQDRDTRKPVIHCYRDTRWRYPYLQHGPEQEQRSGLEAIIARPGYLDAVASARGPRSRLSGLSAPLSTPAASAAFAGATFSR